MGNYTDNDFKNKISYFEYVKKELNNYKTPGTELVNEKLENINKKNISDSDIREICKLVEFLKISEEIRIYFYHEWFKHIR